VAAFGELAGRPAEMTGHPALSLPAGRLPNGPPFGLQVTGPRFGDQMLLALADSWKEARPWPPVADGYEPFDTGIAGDARSLALIPGYG